MNKLLLWVCLGCVHGSVQAAHLIFPEIEIQGREIADYRCAEGKSLSVIYLIASNGQEFARVSVQGQPLLFGAVVSGSGVKYAAGRYVWWKKGDQAFLSDEIDDRFLFKDCIEQKNNRLNAR